MDRKLSQNFVSRSCSTSEAKMIRIANPVGFLVQKRYRELFRQEIADTVADPAEVESELRFLADVLSRK
jgi:hypothetical protein